MTAVRPHPHPIDGRIVRLEPFDPAAHLDGLFTAICRPEVFAGGYGGGPAGLPASREAFDLWTAAYGTGADAQKYVVRLAGGPDAGAIVGASTLGDLDEAREHAHIGWTAYDPRFWGTAVNPATKLLLLGHAFDAGYGRVKLQADAVNARSRAAILKLGAQFEGVIRRDLRRADGSWRDTAIYSVLAEEWPAVRAGLEARIAGASAPAL